MIIKKHFFSTSLVVSLLLLASCGEQRRGQQAGIYKTMAVTPSDRTIVQSYPATLRGVQDVEIYPQVTGQITSICINEGDRVMKGQVLFVIDQVPYKAALQTAAANVESAKAAVATARMTAESKEQLYRDGIVSDFDLRQAYNTLRQKEATLSQAMAELTTARNNLSYTEVKSPVNGTAGMIPYRTGALVSPNQSSPLVTVSDNTKMHVYFSLTEKQMLSLAHKDSVHGGGILAKLPQVELQMSDGNKFGSKGTIDAVSGIIDSNTGTVQVRASFSNADGLLRSGGSANILIPVEQKGRIVIPQEATYELQDKVFVYCVLHGKAKSKQVTVSSLNDGKEYIVESGLKPGDVIVAEGAGLLHEGVVIKTSK